ncbi:unnamed protein product [Macrosiphum euphorbiae]|uniref:MADF domain-containing protein n=1 Tax=Macrosiphum euphorbiae TaxID=13131 RepID=A0AAV0Y1T1_9HEMI|nr:unnamed protein product [Macrosiphum euphorbiae]
MEWPDCKSLELIQLYREKRSLWDPLDKNYKNNKIKFDDWQEIATKLNTDVTNIKKQIESLQGSYCRERQRQDSSRRSGAGTDDLYKSKWFAFNEMQFLKEKYKPRQTKDSMNILNQIVRIDTG